MPCPACVEKPVHKNPAEVAKIFNPQRGIRPHRYIYKRQLGGFELNYFTQLNQQRTLQRCLNSLTCELTRAKFHLITISYRGDSGQLITPHLCSGRRPPEHHLVFYVPFENSSKSCHFSLFWRRKEKKRGQQIVSAS